MDKKYLIAIDLDGTLLKDDKTVGKKTVEYLKKLYKQGHIIVLATGRPTRAVIEIQKQIGISCPIVTYNGSLTSDPYHNRFPDRYVTINKEAAIQILDEIGLQHFDNIMLETPKHIYLFKQDEELNLFFWNENENVIYGNPENQLDDNPMTLIFKPHERNEILDQKIINAVSKHQDLNLRFWNSSVFSEVFLTNGTKKDGLEYICQQLGIDHEQTIVCGDAENDIQMFDWAKYAIAPANAIDMIKEAATIVAAKTNNEDGLIEPLMQIIGQ